VNVGEIAAVRFNHSFKVASLVVVRPAAY
jgi:hypothetical protein